MLSRARVEGHVPDKESVRDGSVYCELTVDLLMWVCVFLERREARGLLDEEV